MKLLVDIGNSRVKWACAQAGELSAHGAAAHADINWQAILPQTRPDSIWVANVAGDALLAGLRETAQARWRLPVRSIASTAQCCGVSNAYPRPERLGVDRWMACIAAHHNAPGSVLIADAGTAVTLDFVDADGQHRGGLISPGVSTMRQALRGGTRLRPEIGEYDLTWLADDTDPAVGLGTLQAVRALLENARRALEPARCILTGGEAQVLLPHLSSKWQWQPHLVLEGINKVAADAE